MDCSGQLIQDALFLGQKTEVPQTILRRPSRMTEPVVLTQKPFRADWLANGAFIIF